MKRRLILMILLIITSLMIAPALAQTQTQTQDQQTQTTEPASVAASDKTPATDIATKKQDPAKRSLSGIKIPNAIICSECPVTIGQKGSPGLL